MAHSATYLCFTNAQADIREVSEGHTTYVQVIVVKVAWFAAFRPNVVEICDTFVKMRHFDDVSVWFGVKLLLQDKFGDGKLQVWSAVICNQHEAKTKVNYLRSTEFVP